MLVFFLLKTSGSQKVHSNQETSHLLPPHLRSVTHTVYGQGASVRPNLPCNGGAGFPSGSLNLKACNKLVTIKKSSILASCSPIHTLRPK